MKVIEKRLRPPANAESPETVCPGPFQYVRQFRPVGNILERQPLDRSTCDDQRIEKLVTDILEPTIETSQIPRFGMTRGIGGCRHENQFDLKR